ncbi:MAG: DNA/RNA non-specific endonuclease [Bacteroidetes bacterium]|nr:DNA/RNA non-specific endonuclease [Bacteroidota bacterium]
MSNKLFYFLFLMLLASCAKDRTTTVNPQSTDVKSTSLQPTTHRGYLIQHTYFSLSYSETNRQAEWVAYNLTPAFINGPQDRTDDFRVDPKVRNNPVGSGDYSGSGYDRGHLCPAADMKLNKISMSETFYMSNMSPQEPMFNRGIWEILESKVRIWAIEKNGVYVITGPILRNICGTINRGTISVPCSYYKIVFKDNGNEKIAIALMLNNKSSTSSLKSFVTSIDNIESLTNIDFFSGLSDDIENKMESAVNTSNWSW